MVAGALSYSTILSLVPFLGMILVTFQVIGGFEFLYPKLQSLLVGYFKETSGTEASQLVRRVMDRLQPNTFGTAAIVGLLLTSWRLLHDIDSGIQKIWRQKANRPLHKRIFISSLLLMSLPLVLAVYFGFRSMHFVAPIMREYNSVADSLLIFSLLYLILKILPEGRVLNRSAFLGAFFSTFGIAILEHSFTFLTRKAFYLSKVYGSLAVIPLLFVWILLLWYNILFGVALSAGYQKNLSLDSE